MDVHITFLYALLPDPHSVFGIDILNQDDLTLQPGSFLSGTVIFAELTSFLKEKGWEDDICMVSHYETQFGSGKDDHAKTIINGIHEYLNQHKIKCVICLANDFHPKHRPVPTHWAVAVMEYNVFGWNAMYLDSEGENTACKPIICSFIHNFVKKLSQSINVVYIENSTQVDGFSCGDYVINNFKQISNIYMEHKSLHNLKVHIVKYNDKQMTKNRENLITKFNSRRNNRNNGQTKLDDRILTFRREMERNNKNKKHSKNDKNGQNEQNTENYENRGNDENGENVQNEAIHKNNQNKKSPSNPLTLTDTKAISKPSTTMNTKSSSKSSKKSKRHSSKSEMSEDQEEEHKERLCEHPFQLITL